jgi:hypothetical protein
MKGNLHYLETEFRSQESSRVWAAAVALGDFIEYDHLQVWRLVVRYESSPDEELRGAIACCVLEHLLEYRFEEIFPLLELEVRKRNRELGDTFQTCWKFGKSKKPGNSRRWDNLDKFVRRMKT